MADPREALPVLRLFSEKAEKLLGLSASLRSLERLSFTLTTEAGKGAASFEGPDGEQVDAFVLTLRFFIQDNEPTSLRRMRQLYRDVAPAELSSRFDKICSGLNEFLDSNTNIRLKGGERLSHRQILEAFVWGDLAHANQAKRALFAIMRQPIMYSMFKLIFADCVRQFTIAISQLNTVNKELVGTL